MRVFKGLGQSWDTVLLLRMPKQPIICVWDTKSYAFRLRTSPPITGA
jgi:hypothetical protein